MFDSCGSFFSKKIQKYLREYDRTFKEVRVVRGSGFNRFGLMLGVKVRN